MATFVPLHVALECQSWGRVDACTFVRGHLDDVEVISVVPQAQADVILYLNITSIANDDASRCGPSSEEASPSCTSRSWS
jgi:hypothetical protein